MRDPALPYLETALALVCFTLGCAALGGGLGTVVLAAGLGITGVMAAALRRRYGGVSNRLPPGGRRKVLRLAAIAAFVIIGAGAGLGWLGYAELTFPAACVVIGVALLLLSPVLDARPLVAAGAGLMVLGAVGAVLALGSAGELYPQGVVGLGSAALLWLFGAQRTGLLAEMGYRVRR